MRRRFLAASLGVFLAAWAIALPGFAQQTGSTIVIPDDAALVAPLIQQGSQLESQHRWAEALTHYEEAIRRFPHDDQLKDRFAFARLHYDLSRRYADSSFRQAIDSWSLNQSLDLYGQVLSKIQSHYVDMPNWRELMDCGVRDLEVALDEPVFLERHVRADLRGRIEPFRQELRTALARRIVASRDDARDAAAFAAQLAAARLGVAPAPVVMEFVCGATNSLDNYSAYLTPNQLNEVYSQIEGNFVGLGVELKTSQKNLLIVRVIPGSPAEKAGLHANDQIVSVDGSSTDEISSEQAANKLQGAEGSVADLWVVSPGQAARRVAVRRERVEVPSIDRAEIVDSQYGIGYLRLTCFQKTTVHDLDTALWQLYRGGMRSLVIDLRGNPGGLLLSSVEAADRFLDKGTIVSTRGRNAQEDFTYSAHPEGTWRVPLVVLIDENSASAAEIFSGAMRDYHRATIVGTRSFGKGSVQGIFPLDTGAAGLRLTTSKFYSPLGRPYSYVGVEPDVRVQTAAHPVDGEVPANDDMALSAALEAARRQVAMR